jgi:hypothetical protein
VLIEINYLPLLALIFLVILLAAKYIGRVDVSFWRLNLLNIVFYRDFLIFTVVSSLYWLSYDRFNNHYVMQVLSKEHIYYALMSSTIFMFLFYLSIYPWKLALNGVANKMLKINIYNYIFLLKIWTWIIFLLLFINYKLDAPPFAGLFQDLSAIELAVLRHEGSQNAVFKILRHSWIPCTFYCWAYIYHSRKKYKIEKKLLAKLRFYVGFSLLLGVIASIWAIQKSLVASFLLGWLGIYLLASNKKLNLKLLSLPVLVFVITIFSFYYFLANDVQNLDSIFEVIVNRFFAQAAGVAYAFFAFPDIFEFKYISGISNFLASVTGEKFSSPYADLINHADPVHAEISGAMSSFVAGEAYGLFGWFGVFLGPFFVAFWYALFAVGSENNNTSVMFVGQYGLFFGNAYMASSFYSFLWPVGFAYSMIPFVILCLLSRSK